MSGDLQVQGDTTTINTSTLDVEDTIIRLNKGVDGGSIPTTLVFSSSAEIIEMTRFSFLTRVQIRSSSVRPQTHTLRQSLMTTI